MDAGRLTSAVSYQLGGGDGGGIIIIIKMGMY